MSYRETLAVFLLAAVAIVAVATLAGCLLFELHPHDALGWGVFIAAIQPWYLLFFPQAVRPRRMRGRMMAR